MAAMTLETFNSERLDALSLRVLDIAVLLRQMARRADEADLGALTLHEKKALEWLGHLEDWAHDATARLELAALKQRGAKKARHRQ
jgi:hypothetical protein